MASLALGDLTPDDWVTWAKSYLTDWTRKARPEQLPPDSDWFVWLILAGRGWGKTRTGAEWLKLKLRGNPGSRWAIVAPTYGDARDTCVEGESGLRSVLQPSEIATWNRSMGELVHANGARVKLFSGDEPERLRGPQHHGAWVDELAAFSYPEAWDQLMFGMRLGTQPQTVVTTTPKPTKLIRGLRARAGQDVHLTVGSTFDNAANLAAPALAELRARYEGTRMGRQELMAEILDDVPGALWRQQNLDDERVSTHPDLSRVVVAIDPAATSNEESDETGIIVAGKGVDGMGYVLADRSCRMSPEGWGRRAVHAYDEFKADRIVAEQNNGGEMITHVLRTIDPRVPVTLVHASRGKAIRAEPVAALYEQGKMHHVGMFPELEDELTTWTPDSGESPNHLDALVWAFTELMLGARLWAM